MKQMKAFTIPFVGLKQGEHRFDYQIDDTFFEPENFEVVYDEFNNVSIDATAVLIKKSNSLEFHFSIKGSINVNCDLTNEPYDQPVKGEHMLVVNFGETFNDEDDALLVLPHGSYEVNIQQYIYELIVLSMPAKRVHPGVADGTLDSEILKKLEELSPKDVEVKLEKEKDIDPRWDELKKLLTDK